MVAIDIFMYQVERCEPYRRYVNYLGVDPRTITDYKKIPFLPTEFFKTENVYCAYTEPQAIFTSSGTTGTTPSSHSVADLTIYEKSFTEAFSQFYGDPKDTTIFALLPNYLERTGSSLIYMVDSLIKSGGKGGFFLNDHARLISEMERAAANGERILLLGVSFALWELAENYTFKHDNMIVMETGGMKGRRREITREELHGILTTNFGVSSIHSEYGMTELLSQGYSYGNGIFQIPSWMKILIRDTYDPTEYVESEKVGGINIIDLANIYSCSFIETQDLGKKYADGSFSVEGRIDRSEIRGCNLMVSA